MTTAISDITSALKKHLIDADLGYDISIPNDGYQPVIGTSYIALRVIWSGADGAEIGNYLTENLTGVLQLSFFSASNHMDGEGNFFADQMRTLYRKGVALTYGSADVRINSSMIDSLQNSGGWFQTVVSINFNSYARN